MSTSEIFIKSKFVIVILIVLLFSCAGNHTSGNDNETVASSTQKIEDLQDLTAKATKYSDSVIAQLSLEERVGQCFMPMVSASLTEKNVALINEYIKDFHIGGIIFTQGEEKAAKKISEIGSNAKVPLFIAIDAEWGLGMRLEGTAIYPKNGEIKQDAEETLLYDYGREVALECKNHGINMVLGPVMDIDERKYGIIGTRSFGGDKKRVANLGVAYAKGIESGGVISVAKHFPGHGSASIDSHKQAVKIDKDISGLDSTDFVPFKRYIDAGLSGVMAGHIIISAINRDVVPSSVSKEILSTLLREEMGFKGLVLTDAFNMGGIQGFSSLEALNNGADIVLSPVDLRKDINEIIEALKEGELDVRIIDEHCKRVLFYKALFNLWKNNSDEKENWGHRFSSEQLIESLKQ